MAVIIKSETAMVQATQGITRSRDWTARLGLVALALNGFAIVTVNYWIYTARWSFIERNALTYKKPPTISRAISDPFIGEPFSFWVTLAAICLVPGVVLLVICYLQLGRQIGGPSIYLRVAIRVFAPMIAILQVVASVGMYMLGRFRFPDANAMHMVGSYTFFVAQALVIVLFTVFNHALLRDSASLEYLHSAGWINRRWVRVRYLTGLASISMAVIYFALFKIKDVYGYREAPVLYQAYVNIEPVVISSFLLILALAHVDIFGRKRLI